MPSWWGKSSSKELNKKENKESFIDTLHRKFKIATEEKRHSRRHTDAVSGKGSRSCVPSKSASSSTLVSRCQSFAEKTHAQPLPLPGRIDSGISAPATPRFDRTSKPLHFLPLPRPVYIPNRVDPTEGEGDLATCSISSDSYIDSDDPPDSRLLSPQASDFEIGNRTAVSSPSSTMYKDQFPITTQKIRKKPANLLVNNQILNVPSKHRPSSNPLLNSHIPDHGTLGSAPDSSMSSPSRSPMKRFGSEQVASSCFCVGKPYPDIALFGSGHCSSPGSGHTSGHNSAGGEMTGQLFWQHSRCSPECSPIPSPRMGSLGPSSRINSGTVTPLHPTRNGGAAVESPTGRPDDTKQKSHQLPLPPLTISNSCPFSPPYSTATTPSVPQSPGRAENPTSPSHWKKGRLLGRGTFGHVYLGFNSESGEMCAMKEVTLFSDDTKSKESEQQLGQEIVLLSRLRHTNIVQYYGSGTVDDKLYIYLEYVSGGSIHKLLQEYGQFGEGAIRSYTQQILSGLAYLHAKNTVHRDIKGANILVDPSRRVKLADFGMAKHITGQSCPLSFKGSPYWMAPEVIKNSSGCNLAVDIWSLGCTVLEMATAKPPWSQYEGVAAMFKIGNSKELPAIPNHLSDDGKDFVRQCLQRNPLHRPTAAKLLEHPFVKNAAVLERPILSAETPEPLQAVTSAPRYQGIGHAKDVSYFESGVTIHQSIASKTGLAASDAHTLKNISSPVSPLGSPLLHSRSPQHTNGRTSPSPICSPRTASGSSTPLAGGSIPIPSNHWNQTYLPEGNGIILRSQNGLCANGDASHQDPNPNLLLGAPQFTHAWREITSSQNGILGNVFGQPVHVDPREIYDGQPVLAARVSQQLLRDHVKLNPSLDLSPRSPLQTRHNGI